MLEASDALAHLAAAGGTMVNQSGLPIAAIGQNMFFHEELQRSAHHADTAARETGRETIKVLRNARGRQ